MAKQTQPTPADQMELLVNWYQLYSLEAGLTETEVELIQLILTT